MAQISAEKSASVQRDLTFRETPERPLDLDLFLPSDDGESPVVVYIHGGAFQEGSKGQLARYALELAGQGYAGAEITYRLNHQAPFPACIQDVKAAIKWVRANADEYGFDEDRIAVMGHSGGGYFSALASAAPDEPALEPDGFLPEVSSAVQAAVCFAGPYDHVECVERGIRGVIPLLGGTPEEVPEQYELSTPANHVDGEVPPTLVCHGTEDNQIPYEIALDYYEAVEEHVDHVEMLTAEGGNHIFLYDSSWFHQTAGVVQSFLDTHL